MTDKANGPMIERRINNLRAIADDETVNNFARSICSEASNYLAAIRSQPVPVEPVATVYDAYDTTGIDWHCKHPPAVGAKIYDQTAIDALRSQLQVAQQDCWNLTEKVIPNIRERAEQAEADLKAAEQNVSDLMAEVAQTGALLMKAESLNRRMVELLKRLSFLAQTTGGTAGRDDDLVSAISDADELLREVDK